MAKNIKFRPKSSFLTNTPEAKERTQEGLRRYREREKTPIGDFFTIEKYRKDIIQFAEEQFYIPETNSPIILENWQKKEIMEPLFFGEREYTMALLGETKKSGKSTLSALVAMWYLFCGKKDTEVYLAARDKDQASWIVFAKLVKAIEMNKYALTRCKITKDAIEVPGSRSILRCLPTDISCAGLSPDLVVFDELWSYEYESMQRFFEEMTTVPTKKNPLILIVTYAGYDDETLLYQLYKKGMELKKDPDPSFFFYWEGENGIPINRMSWQSEKYLKQQRGRLRENTYLRLHENRWVEDITQFIDMDKFDQCVNKDLTPILPNKDIEIWVGIDASVSGDSTAVVAVTRKEDKIILADYKKWQPSKKNPIDLEETVEKYIIDLDRDFNLQLAYYDPYQLHRSAMTLKKKGIRIKELPQTVSNTIDFSQNLYDLIQFGNIEFYPSQEVRRHIKSCRAKEMERGYRIIKGSQSSKIDIAIATAMASFGATITDTDSRVRIRSLDEPEKMAAAEARKGRLKEWMEKDDDFDDTDSRHILPETYHQI